MAVQIRSEYDLPTLRIRLSGAGRAGLTHVEFQTVLGGGRPERVAGCTIAQLGLPERLSARDQLPDHRFRIPTELVKVLAAAADGLGPSPGPPPNALWLELANPRGYLHLVPWEELLAPLGRPVVRLPNHTVRAQSPSDTLEVALCAGSRSAGTAAATAAVLEQLTGMWIEHSGRHVRAHLFTDLAGHREVARWASGMTPFLVVHDPHDAARCAPSANSLSCAEEPGRVLDPWLRWIRDALQRQALDVVQFVTDGRLSNGRGALAIAGTPLRGPQRAASPFVGSAQLSTLLAQVGAWCLVLNAVPGIRSGAALRELADAVAAVRPGVVLVDDLDLDPDLRQLGAAVGMVLGATDPPGTAMPGLVCWAHPEFAESPGTAAMLLTPDRRSTLIGGATQDALTGDRTPSWVASGTRYLEAQQSEWMPDSPDAAEVDPDAAAALRSVSSLLEKHVRRHLDGRPGGAP
ncbi:hypothetical protein [Kitasatospora sp. MBT63]|uniref:hypothetical protein n=1 Tax=Kitasatospora sp. MBT63 TaxID=1444768 RepID=UPI00053B3900|nr:hypothetical protein [Kitasatospora sp. MBT63]